MQFSGKSIAITGAGKGIGRATAELLSYRGANIIALSRTDSDLRQLNEEIGSRSVVADLSSVEGARSAMAKIGNCDMLVNCAGTNVLESFVDMTDSGFETVLGLNLRAAVICAQEYSRARIAAGGGGVIVNVTSIAGHRGFQDHVCYAASKAGLEGASRVMARELGPHGIRVVCLAPTVTMTELAAEAWSDSTKSEAMLSRHATGRFAETEDVARAIAMLLSDDASMITGSVISVDGGFLAL